MYEYKTYANTIYNTITKQMLFMYRPNYFRLILHFILFANVLIDEESSENNYSIKYI